MDGNQVSLTTSKLKISTPFDQGISFSRGEILQGTVREVRSDGIAVMLIKGQLTEAITEVKVQTGQQLFLMVDDFRDGKTYLKILTPDGMKRLENANLSTNIQNIGFVAQEDTVLMARKLLEYNLPVTPQYLNKMIKGINLMGETNQRNMEVIAFALSYNLPINKHALMALLQFTNDGSNLGILLQRLNQSLAQVQDISAVPVPASTVNDGEGILPGIINNTQVLKYINMLRLIIDNMQVESRDRPDILREKIQGLIQSERELIKGLAMLQDIVKKGDGGARLPVFPEIFNQVEGLERELGGQRLFNFLSRIPDSNINYYYFSFPVKIDNSFHLCQLRINREAVNKKMKDQDNIKFIVSLDTAKMGVVLFHVNWNRENNLTIQGVVESERVMNYLNNNIRHLITSLNQMGYDVTNLGIRVAQKDEYLDKLKPQLEKTLVKFRPFSIDVTV
ncbi:MAG: hypothetical protein ACOX6E_07185 [Syntrophomonadaceae bacterium]|jgi:hypothetical protein